MTSHQKNIPIGIDDYEKMITGEYLYIDKTLLIKEFWQAGSEVILVTRPRRFGKSISLSMLRYFFEKTEKSTAHLFKHTKIWHEEGFQELQGTYPVLFLSFKDIKRNSWEEAYLEFLSVLAKEIKRVIKPILSHLDLYDKEQYDRFQSKKASYTEWTDSLQWMTKTLKEHSQKNVIVLIDEYDSPITHAYVKGYYKAAVDFMRDLFSKSLKTNPDLQRAFMTGVVRTAKDGILSGLNHPDVYTMLEASFSDKFGFTESEIDCLLATSCLSHRKEEVTRWYNGYVMGSKHDLCHKIYNPWSVLKYVQNNGIPDIYWANTGSTELLERLIAEADESIQRAFALLMEGGTLQDQEINQDVILLDLDRKEIEPWSFLFFAGYITAISHRFQESCHRYTLSVPNKEISSVYDRLIQSAIYQKFSSQKLSSLFDALLTGHLDRLQELLLEFIIALCSYHDLQKDSLEKSLHLFILGLLASLSERYVIKSNLESGLGRYDILMHPKKRKDPAIILEFKKGKNDKLDKLAEQALKQIKTNHYEKQLESFGYKGIVLCYGIASFQKHLVCKMTSFQC